MSKYFNLYRISFLIPVFFLLSSCKDDDKDKNAADGSTTVSEKGPVAAGLTGGTLSILYTDSTSFNKLKHKLVFSFVFRSEDGLTLAGWDDKAPFDPDPNIELQRNLPVSGVTYSIGTYFGNLVISTGDVNKIQGDIKNKYKYILFTPDNDIPNHIKYKITYTNTLPTTLQEAQGAVAPAVDIYANPSPPRAY